MRIRPTIPLDTSGFARDILLTVLQPHIDCAIEDELIVLEPLGLVVSCTAAESQDSIEDLKQTPLDVVIGSLKQEFEPIRFSLNGIGNTNTESIYNGLSQWVAGAISVLSATFGDPYARIPDVVVEDIGSSKADQGAPVCWRMYLGQPTTGVIGQKGSSNLLTEQLDQQPLITLLSQPLAALRQVEPEINYCWLSVYLTRTTNGKVAGDCLFNDADLKDGMDALKAFVWPDFSPTLAFVRQYAIFKRIPCEETS